MTETKTGPGPSLEEDRLVQALIPSKFLADDRNLFTTKWFDYRFLSPVEATRAYAREFEGAYRSAYADNIDTAAAEGIRPLPTEDPFVFRTPKKGMSDKEIANWQRADKARLSGLWRGRQMADAIGMPYSTFLSLAFKETLKHWKQRYLPRPYQLYDPQVIEKLAVELWPERQTTRLFAAEDPRYRNDRYIGTRDQNDHHEWLFHQVANRGNDPRVLADLVYNLQILPEEKVRVRLGDDAFSRMQSYR